MLYEKDLFTNSNIDCIIGSQIIEYDIRQAGYNIIKYFNLLSKEKIKLLSSLSRENKQRMIGIYQRNDKEFRDRLKDGFKQARKLFFEANDIDEEDVISIKKDAIYLCKKVHTRYFDNLEFSKKNIYSSYYNLNSLELYYNSKNNTLDIKGISNEIINRHNGYMLALLKDVFMMNENDPMMNDSAKLLVEFINEYKTMQLPVEFYREFNVTSLYKSSIDVNGGKQEVFFDEMNEDILRYLDIRFNYINILLPLVRLTF